MRRKVYFLTFRAAAVNVFACRMSGPRWKLPSERADMASLCMSEGRGQGAELMFPDPASSNNSEQSIVMRAGALRLSLRERHRPISENAL